MLVLKTKLAEFDYFCHFSEKFYRRKHHLKLWYWIHSISSLELRREIKLIWKVKTLFILQRLRVRLYNLYTSCSLAPPMFAFGWSSCGRKPEETHLSDLVTTWPSHMLEKKFFNNLRIVHLHLQEHLYKRNT